MVNRPVGVLLILLVPVLGVRLIPVCSATKTRPRSYKTWVHSQTQNKVQWLAACGHVSASSQSLHFIFSPRLCSNFITSRPGLEVIKLLSCSSQWRMKSILLINVKMTTIVAILTFTSRMNTTSDSFKARTIFIFHHFTFHEWLKFSCSVKHEKCIITSQPEYDRCLDFSSIAIRIQASSQECAIKN